MATVDQTHVADTWRARGFSCDLWTDPPGRVWADFVHDVDEVVMLVEGAVGFELDGTVHRPAGGEEVFIPAGVLHTVRNVGGTTSRWLYGYRVP